MVVPEMTAVCDRCGRSFPSGIAVENAIGATFTNVGVGPCPHCGAMGQIPDGSYDAIGDTIRRVGELSIDELQHVVGRFVRLRDRRASTETIKRELDQAPDEVRRLVDLLPRTRQDYYAVLLILITVMMLVLTAKMAQGGAPLTDQQVTKIVQKTQRLEHGGAKPSGRANPKGTPPAPRKKRKF